MVTGCAADLVRVWCVRTDTPDEVTSGLAGLLDDAESRRAAGFASPGLRRRFVVAHGAARLIIGGQVGAPPESIRWRHGPHGKPALAGPWAEVEISLSHSGEFAMLALAYGRRVGVDIEGSAAKPDVTRMAERYYPPSEAAFVREGADRAERARRFVHLWTRKEACVKVEGGGLARGLLLPVAGPSPVLVGDDGRAGGPFLVRDIPAPGGFCAALAAEGGTPFQVDCRTFSIGGRDVSPRSAPPAAAREGRPPQ